ncbi:MAG TPA: hypothetical protein VFD92_24175 [Candidatus Binatia bacterium]|nr:hypothetical protein [Candidatus Binatia bacterium]
MRLAATHLSFSISRIFATVVDGVTDEDILEYQEIWKKEFGAEISKEEARKSATKWLELYRMLFFEPPPLPPPGSD